MLCMPWRGIWGCGGGKWGDNCYNERSSLLSELLSPLATIIKLTYVCARVPNQCTVNPDQCYLYCCSPNTFTIFQQFFAVILNRISGKAPLCVWMSMCACTCVCILGPKRRQGMKSFGKYFKSSFFPSTLFPFLWVPVLIPKEKGPDSWHKSALVSASLYKVREETFWNPPRWAGEGVGGIWAKQRKTLTDN